MSDEKIVGWFQMSKKKIIGWLFIFALALVDFALVQSLLLESNSTVLVAILGAAFFCAGLEGGPAFLGMGIVEAIDKTRITTGQGKSRATFFIIIGGLCMLGAFSVYFSIRRDSIIDRGGFGLPHYDGYYGDFILMIVPFITSLLAFGASIWMSTHGLDEMEKRVELATREYYNALSDRDKWQIDLGNTVLPAWKGHFYDEPLPKDKNNMIDVQNIIERIQGDIFAELEGRLKILIPQYITESTIITPFMEKYISIFRNHVEDTDYLTTVSFSEFDANTEIGIEWRNIQKRIDNLSDEILQHFSTLKGGVVK